MTLIVIIGVACAVVLSAFFSGLETAAYGVNEIRLGLEANTPEGARAARIRRLLANMPVFITTMLVGTNISIDAGTYLLTKHLKEIGAGHPEALTTIILTPVYFMLAETLPKRLAFLKANQSLVASANMLSLFKRLFIPFSLLLGSIGSLLNLILKRLGFSTVKSTGRTMLEENLEALAAEGELSEQQFEMASRIMELEDMVVSDTLLPVGKFLTICETVNCRDAGRKILASGYNRALLITRKGSLSGKMVTVNEIIHNPSCLDHPVGSLGRNVIEIDARTPVMRAINRMREEGARLALATSAKGVYIGAVPLSRLVSSAIGGMRS